VVNCNILINETNKTIEFTSFEPVSDDYTSLPMIPMHSYVFFIIFSINVLASASFVTLNIIDEDIFVPLALQRSY